MRYIEKDVVSELVAEAQLLLDISKHYNQHERVRDIIRILYSGCCAFCESTLEETSFFQIEHFYPKNKIVFKRFIKHIENLHYSCQRCNSLKGRNSHNTIFSPNFYLDQHLSWHQTRPEKIESELYYVGHLLFAKNINNPSINRGEKTIFLFNLNNKRIAGRSNRQYLVESRLRTFQTVYLQIKALFELLLYYHASTNQAIELLFHSIIRHFNRDRSFSTMLIHNFGDEVYKLLSIYTSIREPFH